LYILIAILVFGFLIFIHELGHFLTARLFHVKIHEFAIGMGPKLFWFESKKSGIVYALRMIPIGGFVSMEGELAVEEEGQNQTAPQPSDNSAPPPESVEEQTAPGQRDAGPLAAKPAWQRLIVHVAGAAMNLLFGFLAAIILTCILRVGGTTVAKFAPAEDATVTSESQGLMVGDEILKVNGTRVHISDQLYYEIMHQGGGEDPLILTVRRGDETIDLSICFPTIVESGQSFGDYDFMVYAEKKTPAVLLKQSFFKSCYMVEMVWDSLIDLISGRYTLEAVSGPVGTATVISNAARSGATTLFYLAALISVNLGIFNLLPLPALDGGHIFYTLYELITRRRVPEKVMTVLDMIGFVLLFGLMIVVTVKDVFSLF
jgi:regulator of sigma E protease